MRHTPRQTTAQVGQRTCIQEIAGSSPRREILYRCSLVLRLNVKKMAEMPLLAPGTSNQNGKSYEKL